MPKIDAPTVAEHRVRVQARLVDAAEEILRAGGSHHLTAGAVSAEAGIARNSIYRYVDSVDDLRYLVVARYLPEWLAAVDAAMATTTAPEERIVAWVRVNLEQAAATGHGWLMEAARGVAIPATPDDLVAKAHAGLRDCVTEAWQRLLSEDPERNEIATALTVAIVDAGFHELDRGRPAPLVVEVATEATRSMVDGLRRSRSVHGTPDQ